MSTKGANEEHCPPDICTYIRIKCDQSLFSHCKDKDLLPTGSGYCGCCPSCKK